MFLQRYEKLSQPDRMEYLAINSIYENRQNSLENRLWILLGMVVISAGIGILFLGGLIIAKEPSISVGNFLSESLISMSSMSSFGFFTGIFYLFSMMFLPILIQILLWLNRREWEKHLKYFLETRGKK